MKRNLLGAALAAALAFSPCATLVHAQDPTGHVVSTGTRFTKLSVESVGGFVMISHWQFTLEADGSYSYKRFNEAPITGKATPHELAKVQSAWKSAHLPQGAHQVPGMIPDMPTTNFKYDYVTMGGIPTPLSGSYSGMAQFPANVEKVLTALYAIRDRVEQQASTLAFDELDYSVGGGFAPVANNSKLKITKDGKAHLESTLGATTTPVDGQLTLQEISKLNAAFKAAKVDSLPSNVSAHMVPDAPTFTVKSKVGSKSSSFGGFSVGGYGAYQSRVQPLLDAIRAIQTRLKASATPGATGVIGGNP